MTKLVSPVILVVEWSNRTDEYPRFRARDVRNTLKLLFLAAVLVLVLPRPAQAYIGPGAGFALAGSFLSVLAVIFSTILMLFTWPIRWVVRAIRGRRALARSRVTRFVILGLDGLDYRLTKKFLAEGKLPHMAALAQQGCFKPLATTIPPISPVAWSSFQTGVNPGKHNVFDFLTPDRHSYHPKLSSVEIRPPRRTIRLGKYQWPLGKAGMRLLRKSVPFWRILGQHRIFSAVVRVPITFPPEKFYGVSLSGMCVPDLRGTQGTFSFYSTRPDRGPQQTGGETHRVTRQGQTIRAELVGPANPFRKDGAALKRPFTITHPGRAFLPSCGSTAPRTACKRASIPPGSAWPFGPRRASRCMASASSCCWKAGPNCNAT